MTKIKDLDHSPNAPGYMGETPQENLMFEATPDINDVVLDSIEQSADRELKNSETGKQHYNKLENDSVR